ncbi:MAG: hydrogenase maturation nickel metallochaperone HypA [Candidatus Acetothermia bacterium]
MHEYSVATELIETLEQQVEEEKLVRAIKVHLRLGELRLISKEALEQAYEVLVEDTLLKDSCLEFEEVAIEISCKECNFKGPVEYEDDPAFHFSTPVLSCPQCGGSVEIIKGRELEVRTLTVREIDDEQSGR